ncbi:MAG: MFS transporter [Anaerolineae bacterium]|nr:MFS transporter [Anaerolineae bacterium]MCA9894752.1 MFS transporter [Anaerolineae bacterium]
MKESVYGRISLIMFLRFGAMGLSGPFINVYFTNLGFSAAELGLLISISALAELILIPFLNRMADRLGQHRRLYVVMMWVISVSNMGFGLLTGRWLLTLLFLLNRLLGRGSMSLQMQLTLTRFDQLGKNLLSRSRMWGSIGWIVATTLSGFLLRLGDYPLLFVMSGVVSLPIVFLVRGALPERTTDDADGQPTEPVPRRLGFYILSASAFMYFLGLSGMAAFVWIFIEDLGVPRDQLGNYAAVFAVCELLPMLFMDKIIDRLGAWVVFSMGMFGMAAVWLTYSFVADPVWILVLQLFRGMAFTMYTIGITVMVARTSAPANVATNQAIIQVTMPGLATLLISPILGWTYDNVGSDWMWRLCALFAFIGAAILVLNRRRLEADQVKSKPALS